MGDWVKDRSPKKLKLLIEVPYVAQLKVQVLIFNMNLFSSPFRVFSPCLFFREKVERSLNMLPPEKSSALVIEAQYRALLKIRVKLYSEHYLFSVECS